MFKAAFPVGEGNNTEDTWALEYGKYKNRVSMPKGNHPRLTQAELDIVAEWFARGLPRLTTYIAPDTGPTSCTPSISRGGRDARRPRWRRRAGRAVNRTANISMFGCGDVDEPARVPHRSCPTRRRKSYGTGWATLGKLRVLRELSFNTYYWMRSSADGRFVANGATGGDGAVISDLQSDKDMRVQARRTTRASSRTTAAGCSRARRSARGFCTTGLLVRNPDRIDFTEAECSHVDRRQPLPAPRLGARRRRLLRDQQPVHER